MRGENRLRPVEGGMAEQGTVKVVQLYKVSNNNEEKPIIIKTLNSIKLTRNLDKRATTYMCANPRFTNFCQSGANFKTFVLVRDCTR